jgi:hypothetical protein
MGTKALSETTQGEVMGKLDGNPAPLKAGESISTRIGEAL